MLDREAAALMIRVSHPRYNELRDAERARLRLAHFERPACAAGTCDRCAADRAARASILEIRAEIASAIDSSLAEVEA